MKDLGKYSNYDKVRALGKKYGVDVMISTRKDKKYMITHNGRRIHFGAMGMEDFTKHKDEKRRERFRQRNRRWANAPKYSPSWASYYLLW